MNIKAFDISSEINEKEFYPNDYILDNSLDKDVLNFFNSQKNDKSKFLHDISIKEIQEYANNIIEEEAEEESSESDELIYSKFPDNIDLIKNEIYNNIRIDKNAIKEVINEYIKIKSKFINEFNNNKNENIKEINEKDKFIFNVKKFKKNNDIELPKDDLIYKSILPFKSNEYLMKNINKCFKALKTCNSNNKKNLNKLSQWIYTFLLFLESPLSPEYCADLYSINKYIYNNFIKSSELKIIFIIISEIFKQILIL